MKKKKNHRKKTKPSFLKNKKNSDTPRRGENRLHVGAEILFTVKYQSKKLGSGNESNKWKASKSYFSNKN